MTVGKVSGQPGRSAGGFAVGDLFEEFFDLRGNKVSRRRAVPFDVRDLGAGFVGEDKLRPVVVTSGFDAERRRELGAGQSGLDVSDGRNSLRR